MGYRPFLSPYPLHTHSFACSENCCPALPMVWPATPFELSAPHLRGRSGNGFAQSDGPKPF